MSNWFFNNNYGGGVDIPNAFVGQLGVETGEQTVVFIEIEAVEASAAAATVAVSFSISNNLGWGITVPTLNLDIFTSPAGTVVAAVPVVLPVGPSAVYSLSFSVTTTGAANDGEWNISVSKQ